jgi:hypothetical protein
MGIWPDGGWANTSAAAPALAMTPASDAVLMARRAFLRDRHIFLSKFFGPVRHLALPKPSSDHDRSIASITAR